MKLPEPYFERDGVTLYNCDCREILPTLGKVAATITLVGDHVQVQVRTADPATATTLRQFGAQLSRALDAADVLALQASGTSREADKYILRVMTRVATVDAVDCLAKLLNGQDAMLKEEARQVLQSIHDPKAVVALEAALRKTSEKREKIGLAYSLAIQKSPSSVPLLASLGVDSDLEIARAGLSALATIGGNEALDILKKADASQKVALGLKPDVEEALLIAGSGNAGVVQEVYQSTKSDFVRLAAFLEGPLSVSRNGDRRDASRPDEDVVLHRLDAANAAGDRLGHAFLGAVLGEARQLHRAVERLDLDRGSGDVLVLDEFRLHAGGDRRVVDIGADGFLLAEDRAAGNQNDGSESGSGEG